MRRFCPLVEEEVIKVQEYEQFTEIMEHTQEVIHAEDPNRRVIYSVGCLVWGWRQEYLKEPTSYYIASKKYESLKEELKALRCKIVKDAYEDESESQIQRAEEWLEIALAHKVKHKNRVF